MATKSPPPPEAPDLAAIEAQITEVRETLSALGAMLKAYGNDKLQGAQGLPETALAELQNQLATLESELAVKVRANPLQSLGLAAFAGLVLGLLLRR